ncbi:alpha/beta hydrolase [uncultured Thiocystis sp.]|jgi:pimeloyl-ACP methyl ester carboxylesterase|uniref:alpha/beta hydrolase n=1 Tax=uncultured Thiocystis sp. TaxID=1202134 RepID=UPI0025CCF680|nr:alpha/beta hydrolase [uncultured Thiocystis sp.]
MAVADGVARSRTAGVLRYRIYRPTGADPGDLAVVGHGFLRAKERMAGLATALARSGVIAVTLDFCNDRLWDGGHVRNALAMMAVANALGARRVVYTGFSAGALAALIAARNDRRAVGVVALDLVDAQAMGIRMASGLKRPLIGLVGDASCCNAFQNGLAVYAASPSAVVQRMIGADHCDFESPTDWVCRLTCARGGAISGSPRQDILRSATAAVQSLLRDAAGSETRGEE